MTYAITKGTDQSAQSDQCLCYWLSRWYIIQLLLFEHTSIKIYGCVKGDISWFKVEANITFNTSINLDIGVFKQQQLFYRCSYFFEHTWTQTPHIKNNGWKWSFSAVRDKWHLFETCSENILMWRFSELCSSRQGSYMSAHVLLNLLNKLGEKMRCKALPSILLISSKEFNEFFNTGARMQDSIYHMTLKLHLICDFRIKTSRLCHKKTCF